jgi:hypothetical protein
VPALLGLVLFPYDGAAQFREVVSNQLAISSDEAALHLEYGDDGTFDAAFRDGQVVVDGQTIGSYTRGDALDTAWRALLGEVVTLQNSELARALEEWDPPSSLREEAMTVAEELDRLIEASLEVVGLDDAPATDLSASPAVEVTVDATRLLDVLLRGELIPTLANVLEDIQLEGVDFYIEEDVDIDEPTEGSIVVVDGDLTISERIDGDVVVVRGSVTLDEEGLIEGDLKLVDAALYRDGGRVDGDIERVDDEVGSLESRIRDELAAELREEFQTELRRTGRAENGLFSPFAVVSRGVAGLFEDLITFVILSAMGLGVVYLVKDKLEIVADTARRSPGRAAVVGLAGGFLVLPTWVLGCVALVVSVVGIIALPFWLVLFPIAVALAAGMGYFAVARNIGEWVAAQRLSGLDWLRATNTAYAVMAGVGTLVMFSVAANVIGMVPVLGMLKGLLATLGAVATFTAVSVGFGAVLLTRGGRRPEFYDGTDPFEDEVWPEPTGTEVREDVIEAEEVAENAPEASSPAGDEEESNREPQTAEATADSGTDDDDDDEKAEDA